MKNQEINGKKAKSAESTENNLCKIYYSVTLDIIHIDNNGKSKTVLCTEKEFKTPKALAARRNAFAYAFQLVKDADIDGKLCEGHIDSILEGYLKGNKNINMLFVNVNFIDDEGNIITIYEKEFNAPNEEELEALAYEYSVYRELKYDTGGEPQTVEDEDENQYKIINFGNNEASDSFYAVEVDKTNEDIMKNGIDAEEDGIILLLTQKEIADNYALNQLIYAGKYQLIEVSARGITGVIKPYITGELAAFRQRLILQDKIDPKYIKNIQTCDSRELKLYHDYNARERELHPDFLLSLDAYREALMRIGSNQPAHSSI